MIRPLQQRIVLRFTAGVAVLLLAGALGFYLALAEGYREDADHELVETATLAETLYRVDRGEYGTPAATVAHIITELVTADRAIAAFTRSGQRIAMTPRGPVSPDLAHIALLDASPTPHSERIAGHDVRLLRVDLPDDLALVIGVNDTTYLTRMRFLRLVLGIGLPILLLLGVLLGTRMAEPVMAMQRGFLADAAHELRTPVAIIRSQADAARASTDPAEAVAAVGAIAVEADRMGRLVGDLLLLAREESLPIPSAKPLFLDDLAQRAISRVRALPEAAGRTITLGTSEEAPTHGDAEWLERAILALVHNAVVHAPEGPIVVETGTTGNTAWVRVRDHGPGVPRAARESIFERGARLDASRPGAGLGLPIAMLLARRHGGTIRIADGQPGAIFTLEIPTNPGGASGRIDAR